MAGRLKSNGSGMQWDRLLRGQAAKLLVWTGSALFLGTIEEATEHAHHALQIAVGIDGPFGLETSGEALETNAVVLAPDQPHRFFGRGGTQLLILLEIESAAGQLIASTMCKRSGVTEFDIEILQPLIERLASSREEPLECDREKALVQQVLSRLAGQTLERSGPDSRIQRALDFMKNQPELKTSAKVVAEEVGLSEGRLSHLFREQIGIPIRRYLLWRRLIEALENLLEKESLTTAAHNAGFADSAHFARTFRRMFGVTPSELFKNSRYVQVIPCRD